MQIIKYNNLTWINIAFPTEKDIEYLRENFKFHELVLEELLTPTYHPKVDDFGSYLYFVMHIPVYIREERKNVHKEIDIIVGKNMLVTVIYEDFLEPFDNLFRQCQLEEAACQKYFSGNIGHLLYYIVDGLLKSLLPQLKHMERNIIAIEDKIFGGSVHEAVEEISVIRRDILDFRRTIRPQLLVLESLIERSEKFFGKMMKPYYVDLVGDYNRAWGLLENYKDTIDALHETNDSLLSYKLNTTMKVLTLFTVASLPFAIVPQILSTPAAPFRNNPAGFWITLFIIAGAFGLLLWTMRRHKWF
ncbi:MAG: magnesium transporter CorA family protein [bacterium]|nr:magnesium transporter CorA family protein [bacterium]